VAFVAPRLRPSWATSRYQIDLIDVIVISGAGIGDPARGHWQGTAFAIDNSGTVGGHATECQPAEYAE